MLKCTCILVKHDTERDITYGNFRQAFILIHFTCVYGSNMKKTSYN